jgi:hypothetical protein
MLYGVQGPSDFVAIFSDWEHPWPVDGDSNYSIQFAGLTSDPAMCFGSMPWEPSLHIAMNEDSSILALFGPAPSDIDLTASDVSVNNGVVIAMLSLATVLVTRFTARIVLRNALMADDWAIIAVLVS